MSEEADTPEDSVEGDSGPLCGERLAEARREQQISVLEVAKELHLDEQKVRALERNEFEVLGAPVFAKGHLRKYSQLVGVDADDVFTDYYTMTRADGMPPIVSGRKKIKREISPGPWIAVLVLLLLVAIAYWWFVGRANDAAPVSREAAPTMPQELETESPEPDDAATPETLPNDADLLPEPAPTPAVDADVEPAEPADAAQPEIADQVRVSLSFSGDCWTEISDADGQQLFFKMGRAGESAELSGKAPLSALFGNADNVAVRVNDNDFALPAPNNVNRTVRIAILNQ